MIGGKAKGSVLLHMRTYVHEFHGAAAWERVMLELTSEERAVVNGIVLAGAWYPVEVWNRMLDVFLPQEYSNPDDGMAKLAGYIAEHDLNTVYKMILKMGSPEFLMKRTSSIWSRYFDSGNLTAKEVAPRHWSLQLDLPTHVGAVPGYFTCGPGVAAWIRNGLQNAGAQARLTFEAVGLQCRTYRYEARW